MTIQWFPGHMNKAWREVRARMAKVDMLIEVIDARLPLSSTNPIVTQLQTVKPTLKILNKADLADDYITREWVAHFVQQTNTQVMVLSAHNKSQEIKKVIRYSQALLPHRTGADKPIRTMVLGVPNVGKSTLINALLQRKIAKVADKPGVTTAQQRVELGSGMVVYDTPGLMWPKVQDAAIGFRLALSGAIGVNAYDIEEVAWFALAFLQRHYPAYLTERYQLSTADGETQTLLEHIGRQQRAVLRGNKVDYIRTSEIIVHDFRQGRLGKISLETPDDFA